MMWGWLINVLYLPQVLYLATWAMWIRAYETQPKSLNLAGDDYIDFRTSVQCKTYQTFACRVISSHRTASHRTAPHRTASHREH